MANGTTATARTVNTAYGRQGKVSGDGKTCTRRACEDLIKRTAGVISGKNGAVGRRLDRWRQRSNHQRQDNPLAQLVLFLPG